MLVYSLLCLLISLCDPCLLVGKSRGTWKGLDKGCIHASLCKVKFYIPLSLVKLRSPFCCILSFTFSFRCSPRAPRLLRSSREIRKTKEEDFKVRYSSRGPWDVHISDSSNFRNYNESTCPSFSTFQPIRRILEEDNVSEHSSSFFSEGRSCSTDSSNRDSTSTDEYFDQIFGDLGVCVNSPWRNSSDSETSSSSSSPSPVYLRHSDSDHYAARYSETGISCTDAADSEHFLHHHHPADSTKHCRKLDSSSSCRESGSSKLGRVNPFDNLKSCRNRWGNERDHLRIKVFFLFWFFLS